MQEFDKLSDLEKQQVLKIINEMKDGKSTTYSSLLNDVWDEVPVDIDTFIDDDRYMRPYFYPDNGACLIYPYWRTKLKEIFENPYKYNEIALTGGIGLGKSEIGKLILVYLLYRTMCLKNPQLFYAKPIGKPLIFLCFNNTKDLAEKVLLQPIVDMITTSPWFMERGKLTGREHLRYVPDKNLRIEAGSRDTHALGQDVMCLCGDTEILTEKGYIPISKLENLKIRVFTYSDSGEVVLSEPVEVIKTKEVTELIELELGDSTIIKCTPEHKLLLTNGEYKEAGKLTLDDELMDVKSFNQSGIYKNERYLKHEN